MADGHAPADAGNDERTWADEREQALNLEVHNLLDAAHEAIDGDGPLESVTNALGIVAKLREKLIEEKAFRMFGPNRRSRRTTHPPRTSHRPSRFGDDRAKDRYVLWAVQEQVEAAYGMAEMLPTS